MYIPFARKWRPKDFEEIVGQEHITTTLKNAIAQNRVSSAYLFTGPRGIGKTSTARIFAKALNCIQGPTQKPCNICNICQEVSMGISMDVIEIDGASNRGIDEIRNLREGVKFSPSQAKYKIYIIDEVHMLTTEAFNALLKTLEEPPSHVKFIFATTQPHKVLPTILSRCQRFDFRRIRTKDIIIKLKEISKIELLDAEEEAYLYIASASDGSMRDAESILDQLSSFCQGKITAKDVTDVLGIIEWDTIFELSQKIIERDALFLLKKVDEVLNSGRDASQFILELIQHFRNLMLIKAGVTSEDILDLPQEKVQYSIKQAAGLSQEDIFYIIQVLTSAQDLIKRLLPERVVLELIAVKLARRDSIISLEEILNRLSGLAGAQPEINKIEKIEPKAKRVEPAKPEPLEFPDRVSERPGLEIRPEQEPKPDVFIQNEGFDMTRIKNAWPILIKALEVKKMSIASYLSEGEPIKAERGIVTIGFPKEFTIHKEVLEKKENKESIELTLSQILNSCAKLLFITSPDVGEKNSHSSISAGKEKVIDSALNFFGGRLIKPREE